MPETDIFMWNLQVKKLFFFFFLHHVREDQTKHIYGSDRLISLPPLHLTFPVILIFCSLSPPDPTDQNLTPLGRTILLGNILINTIN